MAGVDEIAAKPLEAALKTGLETLDANQTVQFVKYKKLVLPLDGFVFWVRANLLNPNAEPNAYPFNVFQFNQPPNPKAPGPDTVTIKGSLHFDTRTEQGESEIISVNRCIFTAESRIDEFNTIGPDELYIATPTDPVFEGIRFAFSSRGPYYEQANLFHYLGDAIYADMESQIIDNPVQLPRSPVVTNSLPLWLSLNDWPQKDFEPFGNTIPLYPSFLSPGDLRPPYGTVHIEPGDTRVLAASPTLGNRYQHDQLCEDTVRLTFYGLNNEAALQFVDFFEQYSSFYNIMGLMNCPVIQDEKRVQSELQVIGMKKTITYKVSYLQHQARDIARQLILHCIPKFIFI
jgi:hypothetical protein